MTLKTKQNCNKIFVIKAIPWHMKKSIKIDSMILDNTLLR